MRKSFLYFAMLILGWLLFKSCDQPIEYGSDGFIGSVTNAVDDHALLNADDNPGDWLTYGGNYQEDRYSTLDQINKENVKDLDLAWSLNLGTKRGIEATPIVANGIMYLTGPWSIVYAIDARTGTKLWTYDPKVPRNYGEKACCDVVNRGVALYKGKVYSGTLDGRLIALNAEDGSLIWEKLTVDQSKNYTITGAPRIVKGNVLIGNGGAEYDARGYVSAYDAQSGEMAWRFYTVPGNPDEPFENEILAEAAKTWTGEWWNKGGGGTVWDAIVYDPELNLVYIGVGNGTPWDRKHRSPEGGDNWFLSSIVALNADNGKYVWHYQTTPGDTWDYTATQPLILADLEIEGAMRKVIMQAPKNGFFYVIDRENGEYISAGPFTYQNWAKGIDENGRPIEQDYARYPDPTKNTVISPGPYGGHNWQSMSYNHETRLVYIPTHMISLGYSFNPTFKFNEVGGGASGSGWNVSYADKLYKETRWDPEGPNPLAPFGRLVAYDPVEQKEVWAVRQTSHWNGGVLSTKTGLVFQGDAEGKFTAYDASTGEQMWQADVNSGAIAAPVTYTIDGEQYITLAVGWGGTTGMNRKFTPHVHPGTVFTWKVGGNAEYPTKFDAPMTQLTAQAPQGGPVEIGTGFNLYVTYCVQCHGDMVGAGGGALPDLARSSDGIFENYNQIVLEGMLAENGMPAFGDRLTEKDIQHIQDYLKFTAKSFREGMDPMTYLTEVAKMKYMSDAALLSKY
ncbi:MAG: PQQ-dependent dehydrogenase, methanol/ethanol family [Bacteroidota bacterium]